MNPYPLSEKIAEQLVAELKEAGYVLEKREQYNWCHPEGINKSDSVFILHKSNAIHVTKNNSTKAHKIFLNTVGVPNGKAKKHERHRLDAWIFEGARLEWGDNDSELPQEEYSFKYAEEIPDDEQEQYSEGAKQLITINKYERDPKARKACLASYGYSYSCQVCSFDFEKIYGELGKDYIHVHHLTPLKDVGEKYSPDPENDLIPVCPNCHAMLHKLDDPSDILGLKGLLKQ